MSIQIKPEVLVDNDEELVVVEKPKRKYNYSKEKIAEYSRRSYLKNREKIIAKNKAVVTEKYKNDPEFRKRHQELTKAHREREKKLIAFAKQIIKENKTATSLGTDPKFQLAYSTLYDA